MNEGPRMAVALLLLAAVLASGWWLWHRLAGSVTPPPTPTIPSLPASAPTGGATITPLQAPRGYRLAGVAVGDPASFAVIEAPNGINTLYRVDDEIPGLGRVVRIEAERIVVQSEAGRLDLLLMPGATSTPTRAPAPRTPGVGPRAPTPRRQPAGAASAPGSTP